MNKLISNNFIRKLRNLFLFKPTPYYFPQDNFQNISDFFFWINRDNFRTKFQLINLSSNINPNNPITETVRIWVYNSDGQKIDEKSLSINPFELKEVKFDDYEGIGSFFAFHNFFNLDLKQKKSYAVDRGYVGYKFGDGAWSFIHGNHNACALNSQNFKIQPLIAKSLRSNIYCPQVSFHDCKNFGVIFNNPLFSKTDFEIQLFEKNKLISIHSHSVKSFGTKFINFNVSNISKINLISKIIFCRPIIFKEYITYFDIFHG